MRCPECGSTSVLDEYTDVVSEIVDLVCFDCKYRFQARIEVIE